MGSSLKCARRAAMWPAVTLALAAGMPAFAGDGAVPATKGGLLMLPNVRIVTATAAQRQMAAPAAAPQVRAFKDRDTGRLRGPTPEEMIEIGSQPQPEAEPVVVRTLADGTLAAALGEEAMSHSIVRRSAGGKLESQCVAGNSAKTRALDGTSTQEAHHDHHD